jgi:uncharacterized protein YyaL (SSP411 family)
LIRSVALLIFLASLAHQPAQADPLPGAEPISAEAAKRIAAAMKARDQTSPPRTRHLDSGGQPLFSNRLILETSPYLQQHAHNPVNWYPWGEEAFETARKTGRLIFLSIGYSTCHWCHVMEEESFEDLEVAELLNRSFICVKVDREEHPDVDGVYMEAVQAIAGRGGWPLTVWITADGDPLYGGTYFPPRDGARGSRIGLITIVNRVKATYDDNRVRALEASRSLSDRIRRGLDPPPSVGVPGVEELRTALANYRARFDRSHGGIRSRSKFPSSLPIPFLLRAHRRTGDTDALDMARKTLDSMQRGGIYDHVGGGFHRYTVDNTWTVPHFEKMLYDNALLSLAYIEAYQVTGEERYAEVVRDTLDYVGREMASDEGTFYAATDADSEGEEGKYFVWTPGEVREAVGAELAPLALATYGVTDSGNFEGGRTVLRRDLSEEDLAKRFDSKPGRVKEQLQEIRRGLRATRSRRIPPHTDQKQIVAWNGLAISAFARAGLVLGDVGLAEQGARSARVILSVGRPEGRLARYLLDGHPRGTGVLDDYAFLIAGLLDLHEATTDTIWLDHAVELQTDLDGRFQDESGAYYLTPSDGSRLIVREKPFGDGALPSGNSIEALNLMRLYLLTTNEDYRMRAEMAVRVFSEFLADRPTGFGRMLDALDFMTDRPKEILIVTPNSRDEAEPFVRALARVFLPNRILVVASESEIGALSGRIPLLENKRALGGKTTAYVCERHVCDLPARDVPTFAKQIRKKAPSYSGGG